MCVCVCVREREREREREYVSNSGTSMELRTSSFIESTEVACSDSVSHNRVQVLSTPVLLQTPEEGQKTYRRKRCEKNYKMKTIVRKPLMIKRYINLNTKNLQRNMFVILN